MREKKNKDHTNIQVGGVFPLPKQCQLLSTYSVSSYDISENPIFLVYIIKIQKWKRNLLGLVFESQHENQCKNTYGRKYSLFQSVCKVNLEDILSEGLDKWTLVENLTIGGGLTKQQVVYHQGNGYSCPPSCNIFRDPIFLGEC